MITEERASDLLFAAMQSEPRGLFVSGYIDAGALIEQVRKEVFSWQPRETAPKDGEVFIALTADFQYGHKFNERVQEARWNGESPTDRKGYFQSRNGQMIIAWMPFPNAPKP